jgi:catechol 2,3-dioxygenase
VSIDPRVDIGHVHLKVADLDRAIDFYVGVLGFELMQRFGDQAAFVAAGGYHHHLGLNTWAGEGAPPPPEGSRGLREFEIVMPSGESLVAEEDRLREAGFEPAGEGDRVRVTDPSGNRVVLAAA